MNKRFPSDVGVRLRVQSTQARTHSFTHSFTLSLTHSLTLCLSVCLSVCLSLSVSVSVSVSPPSLSVSLCVSPSPSLPPSLSLSLSLPLSLSLSLSVSSSLAHSLTHMHQEVIRERFQSDSTPRAATDGYSVPSLTHKHTLKTHTRTHVHTRATPHIRTTCLRRIFPPPSVELSCARVWCPLFCFPAFPLPWLRRPRTCHHGNCIGRCHHGLITCPAVVVRASLLSAPCGERIRDPHKGNLRDHVTPSNYVSRMLIQGCLFGLLIFEGFVGCGGWARAIPDLSLQVCTVN